MGSTMSLPEKDRFGYGRRYIHDTMRVLCGGRIAEEKRTEDVSSGASMDIEMMTSYAPGDGPGVGHERPARASSTTRPRTTPTASPWTGRTRTRPLW